MDWFDRRIVQYMLHWQPFGGPPEEEVLPRFGMSLPQLNRRFDRIVKRMEVQREALRSEDVALLSAVNRVKVEAAVKRELESAEAPLHWPFSTSAEHRFV
jgi:hypothetical protein